jgi:hypothetical protein
VGSISFERIVSALILFAFDSTVGSEARKLILGIHPYSRLLPLAQLS